MEGSIKDSSGKDTYREEVEDVLHLFECLLDDIDAIATSIVNLCYKGRYKKIRLPYRDGRSDLTRDYGGLLYVMRTSSLVMDRFYFESKTGDTSTIQQYKTMYSIMCGVFDELLDSIACTLECCNPEISIKSVLGEDFKPYTEVLEKFCA